MDPKDMTERIRHEHHELDELADRLERHIATVPRPLTGDWIGELRESFEEFRARLVKHMAMEESRKGGFMLPVLERRPALADRIERLRHEHTELVRIFNDLHLSLEDLTPADPLRARDVCMRIRSALGYVEHHENDENDLVEFVFTEDIGTKD